MTWKNPKERERTKARRGSRKQIWLSTYYAAVTGTAVAVLARESGVNGRKRVAAEIVAAARQIADAAVEAEFGK